jgi:hypothetical protein
MPFGVVSLLRDVGKSPIWGPLTNPDRRLHHWLLGSLIFINSSGWAGVTVNISEKVISHDPGEATKDLQSFILLFLTGELMAFGAVFGISIIVPCLVRGFGPVHAHALWWSDGGLCHLQSCCSVR